MFVRHVIKHVCYEENILSRTLKRFALPQCRIYEIRTTKLACENDDLFRHKAQAYRNIIVPLPQQMPKGGLSRVVALDNILHWSSLQEPSTLDGLLMSYGTASYKNDVRCYSTNSRSNERDKSSKEKSDGDFTDDMKSGSKTAQLKRLFAIYGSFAVGFHIAISLVSLGICYLVVSSGVDVVGLLQKMGIELSTIGVGASTFVIAYAIHKLILPLRASITIISVPLMVRYLRRAGYFKK